jgi:hypothetical protein
MALRKKVMEPRVLKERELSIAIPRVANLLSRNMRKGIQIQQNASMSLSLDQRKSRAKRATFFLEAQVE